jgi:hypothetical protein
MIDAYLDEAGIHDGAPMCLISGFWGGRGQWRKVENAWRKVLHRYDVPIDEFHALQAVKRRKLFQGMDDKTHARFMMDLVNSIIPFKIYPIMCGIVVDDFNGLPIKQRRFLTGAQITSQGELIGTGNPNKPYFAPFFHLVRRIASYAPVGGRAHFFFGLDRPFAGYAQEMFRVIKSGTGNFRERIGDPSFPLAKETPQLQAADFFAYLNYDHGRTCLEKGTFYRRGAAPFETLTRKARDRADLVFLDRETLQTTLRGIPFEHQIILSQ